MKTLSSLCLILATLFSTCCATATDTTNATRTAKEVVIKSDHADIYCKVIGEGNPILVLHGGPGLTHDYLFPQMSKLAETNCVIFYDQRGCGLSTGEINPDSIQISTYLDDIEAIRESFGYKKMTVLGHSWGGFLAMQYAIAYPKSIDKLIILNPTPVSSDDLALFEKELTKRFSPYQEELNTMQNTLGFTDGEPKITELYWQTFFKTYCYNPEKVHLLNLRMSPQAAANVFKVYNIFSQNLYAKPFNFHDQLKALRIDTLIIHGDADPIPASAIQKIHESIPHSKYILLKDCGHFPYVETPDIFFNHLNAFLKSNVKNGRQPNKD